LIYGLATIAMQHLQSMKTVYHVRNATKNIVKIAKGDMKPFNTINAVYAKTMWKKGWKENIFVAFTTKIPNTFATVIAFMLYTQNLMKIMKIMKTE